MFNKVISRNFDSYSCMNICRVDEFGGHVTGEGHYGFCSTDCLDSEGLIKHQYFQCVCLYYSGEEEENVPVIFIDEIPVILGYPK